MSNDKQSSLELFALALYEKGFLQGNGDEINDLLEQSKAMHKQEIIDAYHISPLEAKWQNKGFEYYNETYGGNK